MFEFLLIIALIWLIIAGYEDIKKREVANWLSFSLIIFALGYRLIYSVINKEIMFFIYGLFGFAVFFLLAYIFYYARVFAGGDAKLLIGLGAVLTLAPSFFRNIMILGVFVFLLLAVGGVYGLVYSVFLVSVNKKKFSKEFEKQFRLRKSIFYLAVAFAFLSLAMVFYAGYFLLFVLPLIFILFPFLYVYAKAVEESCMIKEIAGSKVTVGDWLYEEVIVRVGGKKKKIKPYWEGLSEEEVQLLRNSRKKVKIKQGIPFVPSFLISYVLLILLKNYFLNLPLI